MQVGVSQPSSPSLFSFLSCFYLPEKQDSRFLDFVTPSGDPLSGFLGWPPSFGASCDNGKIFDPINILTFRKLQGVAWFESDVEVL